MKHVFILNPASGSGKDKEILIQQIISFVKKNGADFEIHRTLNKAEVGSYVRKRCQGGCQLRFYAVGGDGTICDVVNGMAGFDNAELAIIPCGSGNDFVKNFSNTSNFTDLEKQLNGTVEKVDLIKFNNQYAINMLNIGADCDVAERADELRDAKKFAGALSYAKAALEIIPQGRTYDLEYEDEEGRSFRKKFMLVSVGNGKFCGGGFKSCPKASIRDGLLDLGFVNPVRGAKIMKLMVKYHGGTHVDDPEAQPYLHYFQTKKFTLTPYSGINVCVDGEIQRMDPIEVEVIPRGINVVVPKGSTIID